MMYYRSCQAGSLFPLERFRDPSGSACLLLVLTACDEQEVPATIW